MHLCLFPIMGPNSIAWEMQSVLQTTQMIFSISLRSAAAAAAANVGGKAVLLLLWVLGSFPLPPAGLRDLLDPLAGPWGSAPGPFVLSTALCS